MDEKEQESVSGTLFFRLGYGLECVRRREGEDWVREGGEDIFVYFGFWGFLFLILDVGCVHT